MSFKRKKERTVAWCATEPDCMDTIRLLKTKSEYAKLNLRIEHKPKTAFPYRVVAEDSEEEQPGLLNFG